MLFLSPFRFGWCGIYTNPSLLGNKININNHKSCLVRCDIFLVSSCGSSRHSNRLACFENGHALATQFGKLLSAFVEAIVHGLGDLLFELVLLTTECDDVLVVGIQSLLVVLDQPLLLVQLVVQIVLILSYSNQTKEQEKADQSHYSYKNPKENFHNFKMLKVNNTLQRYINIFTFQTF